MPSRTLSRSLRKIERNPRAPRSDLAELLVSHDLEFHDSMMRSAVQLSRLQQADVVGTLLMAHQRVDIPRGWWRLPAHELRWDGHVETVPGVEQHVAFLEPRGGFEEGSLRDAEGRDGFGARECNAPLRLEGRDEVWKAGTGL